MTFHEDFQLITVMATGLDADKPIRPTSKQHAFWAYDTKILYFSDNDRQWTRAGRNKNKVRVTTTYSIQLIDEEILGNTDGGSFTVTLPAGVDNQHYRIINTGNAGNILTVGVTGADELFRVNGSFNLADQVAIAITFDTDDGYS